MQPENFISNSPSHPNYKRVIIAITAVIVIALLGVLGYQYFVNKKAMIAAEEQLRIQRQVGLIDESRTYFAELPPRTQEVADKDRNAAREFFKTLKPVENTQAVDQDTKDFFQNNI